MLLFVVRIYDPSYLSIILVEEVFHLVIHSFATSKVQMVFLVSIFLPQCSHLCSTLLCSSFKFSTTQGPWFHSFVKEAT